MLQCVFVFLLYFSIVQLCNLFLFLQTEKKIAPSSTVHSAEEGQSGEDEKKYYKDHNVS